MSGTSLEKNSRPASAGGSSQNDVTNTNGMDEYPYVPDNAFAGSPDKHAAVTVVRAVPPPQPDDFYTTGDPDQLGQPDHYGAQEEYDPFGGHQGPNPFDAKPPTPPTLSGFKRPDDDPFSAGGQRKSIEAGSIDGQRRRRSLANQLAAANSKSQIEVVATNPRDTSRPSSAATTEDRQTADKEMEALFLPNLKREQYIPVRVARDKIKHVLAEMAQMKTMHLAAIETMEKQHSILKTQLENACAAYCRKLTTDYNNRLTALEVEYKKRLTQAGQLRPPTQLGPLENRVRQLEQLLQTREEQLALAQSELLRSKQTSVTTSPAPQQNIAPYEQRIRELEQALGEARQVPEVQELEALREENMQLRAYCEQLEAQQQQQQQPEAHEQHEW